MALGPSNGNSLVVFSAHPSAGKPLAQSPSASLRWQLSLCSAACPPACSDQPLAPPKQCAPDTATSACFLPSTLYQKGLTVWYSPAKWAMATGFTSQHIDPNLRVSLMGWYNAYHMSQSKSEPSKPAIYEAIGPNSCLPPASWQWPCSWSSLRPPEMFPNT